MVIKSVLAFFFLFFLHGFSIGNSQQGISYNGLHIGAVGDLEHESFSLPIHFIRCTTVQFIT
jgi:hypothetical protein